jgi:hypothetical protein
MMGYSGDPNGEGDSEQPAIPAIKVTATKRMLTLAKYNNFLMLVLLVAF